MSLSFVSAPKKGTIRRGFPFVFYLLMSTYSALSNLPSVPDACSTFFVPELRRLKELFEKSSLRILKNFSYEQLLSQLLCFCPKTKQKRLPCVKGAGGAAD